MLSHLWESEKLRLSQILFIRVTGGKEQLRYQDILDKGFPHIFEICVKNRARKLFSKDQPVQLNPSARYNLESPHIQATFEQLKTLLLQETVFTRDELFELVKVSINFQYDVLVRPRQKLREILFKSKAQSSKEDISVVVKGFGEERPFIHNLIQAIESIDSQVISKEGFEKLTKQIEQDVYRQTPIAPFLKEISLLLDFETTVTGENQSLIRSHVLTGMLRERELTSALNEINTEAKRKDHWSINEIESVLERHFLVGNMEAGDEEALTLSRTEKSDSEEIPLDEIGELDLSQEDIKESTSDAAKDASGIRIAFEEEEGGAADKSDDEELASEPDSKELSLLFDDEEENIPIDRDQIEKQPPGPYPELRSLINSDDQKKFVKKIFSEDVHQYTEFIQSLEKSDSWKEAKSIIDNELADRQINPYSEEAVRLGDIVFSRYFS